MMVSQTRVKAALTADRSYYRLAGVNALISVVLNLLILLAIMAYVPVTLTLPGIAGLRDREPTCRGSDQEGRVSEVMRG